MRDDNIFSTGGVVQGDSMIGYTYHKIELKRTIKNKLCGRGGVYVFGLYRIGKTSLVHLVCNEINQNCDNVLYIYLNVNMYQRKDQDMFANLLSGIVSEVKHSLKTYRCSNKDKRYIEEAIASFQKCKNSSTQSFRDTFEDIFSAFNDIKCKVLLVLDEFDAAQYVCRDKADFELLRCLTSESKHSVCLVTVSRRPLYLIEHQNPNNSSFKGVMYPYIIQGFQQDDVQDYYNRLERWYNISLSDDEKENLEFYCGISPYLFSYYGYEMVELQRRGKPIDIKNLYFSKIVAIIKGYHEHIRTALEYDMDECGSFLKKLIGILIGPSYFLNSDDVPTLMQIGYLMEDSNRYYSISPAFNLYLLERSKNSDIINDITILEKNVKLMLDIKAKLILNIQTLDDNNWYYLLDQCYNNNFNRSIYQRFITDNLKKLNVVSTVLDVMSLNDAFKIIEKKWEYFADVFDNDPFDKWKHKFEACAKARNPLHHAHAEYLSSEEQAVVIAYCHEIIMKLKAVNHVR